ncbi:hypothetical protein [Microbacterium thalassium]|uniref:Uncharacterized protein n=1 Tax=Microbacterium thalassium TaxID=362649 RepID=A0A7X0KUG3_9MICO|nr:hypothetical protein [Microbacterium thalassium]MBB6391083.1 hypothetical protein [Microbacterium thalassium]
MPIDITWAGAGYPRDVKRALGERPPGREAELVVVAKEFSEGSRELLSSLGVSWVSMTGSASLRLGPIWVDRQEVPPKPAPLAPSPQTWTAAVSEVAEVCLADRIHGGERVPRVEDLSARTGRSFGTVSRALRMFDASQWTGIAAEAHRDGSRRVWIDPSDMLDSWAAYQRDHRTAIAWFHTLSDDLDVIARRLEDALGRIAITGGYAAGLLAPFATAVTSVRCYTRDEHIQPDALREAGLTPVARPSRVGVSVAGPSILGESSRHDGLTIASPVRVYADVLTEGVRGEDLADHLRTHAIGF